MVSKHWRLHKQKYALVGSKCKGCGTLFFPTRQYCAGCESTNVEDYGFSGHGVIETYTTIHVAPAGFNAPYVVAIIRLDEGVSIVSQMVAQGNNVEAGKNVEAVFRKISENKSDVIKYGFKFEVV